MTDDCPRNLVTPLSFELEPRPHSQPPGVNPYLVFQAWLAPGSRPAMADALASIARITSGGRVGPEALPWHQLRYQHTQAIRQRLVDTVSERTGKPLSPATVN